MRRASGPVLMLRAEFNCFQSGKIMEFEKTASNQEIQLAQKRNWPICMFHVQTMYALDD